MLAKTGVRKVKGTRNDFLFLNMIIFILGEYLRCMEKDLRIFNPVMLATSVAEADQTQAATAFPIKNYWL